MVGLRALLRFGAQEWRLVRLVHRVHGHIGIYTTIGVKMGLHARELLGAPLSVLSFAGNVPPVSCMNDGLQIGAGATLGHGQITVSDDPDARAEAEFRCGEISGSVLKNSATALPTGNTSSHLPCGTGGNGTGSRFFAPRFVLLNFLTIFTPS